MRRQVSILPSVYNAKTGQEITNSTSVTIFLNNEWIKLQDFPKEKLISGNVFKVKFTCEGYQEEIFSLRLDWLQDTLYIGANLMPNG